MLHDEDTIQQRVAASLDWLISRAPDGHEHVWTATTPDDPIQWCSQCGLFRVRPEKDDAQ